MFPNLFSIGAFELHSFGLCLAMAILSVWWVTSRAARRAGETPDRVQNLIVLGIVAGVLGARLFFVLEHWTSIFAKNPSEIFSIWNGGLMYYGGLIVCVLALAAAQLATHRPMRVLLDLGAMALPLGQAWGRLGCFLNGCCHGRPAPEGAWFGVVYPAHSIPWYTYGPVPLWPSQLLECAGSLVLFALLFLLFRKLYPAPAAADAPFTPPRRVGLVGAAYLVGYAVLRFLVEMTRGDERAAVAGLSISQFISVCMLVLAAALIAFSGRKIRGRA